MNVRRGRRRLLPFAVLPLVVSCGSSTAATDSSPQEHPAATRSPVLMADGQVQVGCGGTKGWSPSVMKTGLPGVLTRDEVHDAFTDLLANPKYRGELAASFLEDGPAATPWRVLRVDGDTYTLGLGRWSARGPGEGASVFEIQGSPGDWAWTGGGDCHLAPVLTAGNEWVQLTLPDDGLDRGSTHPEVGVSEVACASGRDPRPHLHAAVVEETPTAVTVYWTATAPTGNNSCVGRAPVDVRLHLASPLGGRALRDGSSFPPSRVVKPTLEPRS